MALLDMFDSFRYEKKIRAIKDEHFSRVADLEDKIHQLRNTNAEMEHSYKLQVQEIVAKYEKELQMSRHVLELEKKNWEVDRSRLEFELNQKLGKEELKVEKEMIEKLKVLVEREGKSKDTIVQAQVEILKIMKESIPNLNWNRNEGSPALKIDIEKKNG